MANDFEKFLNFVLKKSEELGQILFVPWPNFLWAYRWTPFINNVAICYSWLLWCKFRKIMFLMCSTNNLAETYLNLFNSVINDNYGLWRSRIRVDYGVETVLVCGEMVAHRCEGRGSFIAGASTSNQRIERLLLSFLCDGTNSNPGCRKSNPYMFALHLVFTGWINAALDEFVAMFNNHHFQMKMVGLQIKYG